MGRALTVALLLILLVLIAFGIAWVWGTILHKKDERQARWEPHFEVRGGYGVWSIVKILSRKSKTTIYATVEITRIVVTDPEYDQKSEDAQVLTVSRAFGLNSDMVAGS